MHQPIIFIIIIITFNSSKYLTNFFFDKTNKYFK